MKSFILTAGFLILTSLFCLSGTVEQVYTFKYPEITARGDHQLVTFPNTLLTGLPGEPILPYMQVKLLLPPGEAATHIEVIGYNEVFLPGSFLLPPQQQVKPLSDDKPGDYHRNEAVYQLETSYPSNPQGKLITSYLKGHSVALSTFTPVKYIPSSGKLSFYSSVKVIVHTSPSGPAQAALQNLRQGSTEMQELGSFIDNASGLESYITDNTVTSDDYQILIVTAPSYAEAFESLRLAYLEEGLETQVVTTAAIASSVSGLDLQEQIRNYIIQEYQLHGIEHVILGGDDELIPNRGFFCHVQSSSVYEDYGIPSDLYYSALDGNWNADGDDKWAEPEEDDLLPDISVGRLSFSNAFELNRMLHKTYSYQFTPVPGEFQKVLMAGENLYDNPETWGSDYLELLIGAHEDNGYSTTGIPELYDFNKMYDENTYWSGTDLIQQINQGYPMLHHSGHANETYVMKLSNWDITDQNFFNVNGTTHNYTLVYTHGCLCGSFDFDDCIAEEMVSINNFAAAFVGNSRYGWFNEGQTEGPSAHLHREFLDALYTDKLNRLGRAHMESKIATSPWVTAPGQWEPGALRWCFYDCNVLGDPVMAVWTNNPINISTVYPATVTLWSSGMNVNVTSNGMGVAGLSCVVIMNGQMLGKALTDAQGNAVITFDYPVNTVGEAELVVSGYNCLPTSYPIAITPTTGLGEPSATGMRAVISPNPVKDILNIRCEHKAIGSVTFELVMTDGRTLALSAGEVSKEDNILLSWNAGSLKPGLYWVKADYGDKVETLSFIKE